MTKLLALALLTSSSVFGATFTYIQGATQNWGNTTQVFPSATTAGHIIVVVFYDFAAISSPPTDSQGNTYVLVSLGASRSGPFYVAMGIAGGADTVSIHVATCCAYDGAGDFQILEYAYDSTCPAGTSPAAIDGAGGTTGAVSGGSFTTLHGAMAIIGMYDFNGVTTFTLASGTVRFSHSEPGSEQAATGDDYQTSIPSAYTNTISGGATGNSVIFLYCKPGASSHTFPIIY